MGWTKKDIRGYSQIKSEVLDSLYRRADIPLTSPDERLEYLENNILKLDLEEKKDKDYIISHQGLPKALNCLERMFLDFLETFGFS